MFGVKCNRNLLKYERIVEELREAVRQKVLRRGDGVPSITRVSREYGCARETVVKAYKILKEQGVIESRPSKGFYIASEHVESRPRIFLLLNSLLPYIQVLYDSFMGQIANQAAVDVYFHHYNISLFEQLVIGNLNRYDSYVIKPFKHEKVGRILSRIDPANLLILDRREGINETRSYISQDFNDDFFTSLKQAVERLRRYKRVNLVFPGKLVHPRSGIDAFERFCQEYGIEGCLIGNLNDLHVKSGEAYITIADDDLVEVLKQCKAGSLEVGRDIGIISYNDTPIKEFVSGGITSISVDFAQMGREAAEFALKRSPVQKDMSASLILRGSL